jgi:hypothetical protein
MSYILDALSKSQRERERTTVPTLTTDFPVQPANRRAPKVLVGAAIGMLALGVLMAAYGLHVRAPAPKASSQASAATAPLSPSVTTTAVPTTAVPTTAVPTTAVPTTTVTDRRQDIGTPQRQVQARSASAAPQMIPRPRQTASAPVQIERAVQREKSSAKAADSTAVTRVANASEPSQEALPDPRLSPATRWLMKEMAALEKSNQQEVVAEQEAPARGTDRMALASTAAGAGETRQPPLQEGTAEIQDRSVSIDTGPGTPSSVEVPALRDLPAETRSTIPALEVNVHTYAQASEGRMVFINMKRYGEGDRLKEGPVVDAITPDGVVLVHGQRRFRLPAR